VHLPCNGGKSSATRTDAAASHRDEPCSPRLSSELTELAKSSAHVQASKTAENRIKGAPLHRKASLTLRWLPSYAWQRIIRRAPDGPVHLVIALADHFEPSIVPEDGRARASQKEQQHRVDSWCREYPSLAKWRDAEGHVFKHTYFYPAEQYDKTLLDQLAHHCDAGWGELEIHLHHGSEAPDTEENTRRQLIQFRDKLVVEHGALSYLDGGGTPRYAFVHGNFALANTASGHNCGVDSEMQILADTGCYADMTLPPGRFHPAHIAKINSLYECSTPLYSHGAHRRGVDLQAGRPPSVFPLMVEGPLMLRFENPEGRISLGIENGSLTSNDPPTLYRLQLWKQAAITVKGRPDWLFVKLQCHGMDPRDRESMLGAKMHHFLEGLVSGAEERNETLHFVTAREMANVILAACDGHEGNPGEYRDYRLKRGGANPVLCASTATSSLAMNS